MAKGLLEGLEICSFYDPIAVLGLQDNIESNYELELAANSLRNMKPMSVMVKWMRHFAKMPGLAISQELLCDGNLGKAIG